MSNPDVYLHLSFLVLPTESSATLVTTSTKGKGRMGPGNTYDWRWPKSVAQAVRERGLFLALASFLLFNVSEALEPDKTDRNQLNPTMKESTTSGGMFAQSHF
ncbi:hypothetical protein K438DRAFT_1775900 [Mycena galopus ATCC 62051]|nr:hypothetical protein K438DRAFT_1775900 [Mycena galopus ATCC 62051]